MLLILLLLIIMQYYNSEVVIMVYVEEDSFLTCRTPDLVSTHSGADLIRDHLDLEQSVIT